jgi:hypothetical protein
MGVKKLNLNEEALKESLDKLQSVRIFITDNIPRPPTVWGIDDSILGTVGNFSVIIGKAKSRKSFLINLGVACAVRQDGILNRFNSTLPEGKKRVVYFDTEQGNWNVYMALQRICTQADVNNPQNFEIYALRKFTPQERLKMIDDYIKKYDDIGLLIIDGIKDLVTSINDEEQATKIASNLLKWTAEKGMHIVTVLHQNKSDTNARGHIGTELQNKAETVLSVSKMDNNKDISIVEAVYCRHKEPDQFGFTINHLGIPVLTEDYQIFDETKKGGFDPVDDFDIVTKGEIVRKIFKNQNSIMYSELKATIKEIIKNDYHQKIGDNKVKGLITHLKINEMLYQEKGRQPYEMGRAMDYEETDELLPF